MTMRSLLMQLLLAASVLAAPASAQPFTPEQRESIVRILREALVQDPSILRDAITAMQEDEARQAQQAVSAALSEHRAALERDPEDPVLGNPDGDVTVVEFLDPRCGYCKQLHPTMRELLRRDPMVRLVVKDIPILGPNSVFASHALLAAQAQGKYEPLLEALMALRGEPTEAVLKEMAGKIGLDWARLRRDMQDPAITRRIEGHLGLARALGIQGTPALVIGDALIPGAVDIAQLQAAVAAARGR